MSTYGHDDWAEERARILATMTRDAIRAELRERGAIALRAKTKADYAGRLATARLEDSPTRPTRSQTSHE